MSANLLWDIGVQPAPQTTLRPENPAVAVSSSATTLVDNMMVDDLIARADRAEPRRSRVLLHRDRAESLHEMLIALPMDSCDIPHINWKSGKSFHVVRGRMVLMVFSDDGRTVQPCRLNAVSEGGRFMARLNDPCWHTIIPCTPFVVFIETIIGPFTGNQFAPWAPQDMRDERGQRFSATLRAIAQAAE